MAPSPVTVFCVDDNEQVGEALRVHIERRGRFRWAGSLDSADRLLEELKDQCPTVLLMDIDMPGKDPFEALGELMQRCTNTRAIIFSGHTRLDLIERAVDAGAWAYVSKNDGEQHLFEAIERVLEGDFFLSPEPNAVFGGGRG